MEKIRRLLAVIAGVAILGGLGLAAAGPAAASSGPYVDAHATGWARPQVRPTFITVGQGCAPQEHHLQWSHWGKYTAFGTSDDVLFPPGLLPAFRQPVPGTAPLAQRAQMVHPHDHAEWIGDTPVPPQLPRLLGPGHSCSDQ